MTDAAPILTSRRQVLWWGSFDPEYARNRILRRHFSELGWQVVDFHPAISPLGDWQARLLRRDVPDLVWVPCFRQRDIAAARRWARGHGIPLVIDPFISAYDKQVFERRKLDPASRQAARLLAWERRLFQGADRVVADTRLHAEFFADVLGVARERLDVVHIGAEETLFTPAPHAPNAPLDVLFYGSFIALQGPEYIVDAALRYQGPPVHWHLAGEGPLLAQCQALAHGHPDVHFEEWIPYVQLPQRIQRADILLGIFGRTDKARRVIPNKAYQALACGKPLITRRSEAYPEDLRQSDESGIAWAPAGDADALAAAVARLASQPEKLNAMGAHSRESFMRFFSADTIRAELAAVLSSLV
ncbi:MAG: glycosyltransferase [Gammaproteobacteria bacterium]